MAEAQGVVGEERRWEVNGKGNEGIDFIGAYEGEIRHGEVSHQLDALLVEAAEKTASTATQVVEAYGDRLEPAEAASLRAMSQVPAFVAGAPEEGWKLVAQENRKQVEILTRIFEGLESGRRLTYIGWSILIVLNMISWAIALGII